MLVSGESVGLDRRMVVSGFVAALNFLVFKLSSRAISQ